MPKKDHEPAKPADKTFALKRGYFGAVQRPGDRNMAWYLNLLAGTLEGPVPGHGPYTAVQAACRWARVDPADHTLISALNVKARNGGERLPVRAVLNQLAQQKPLHEFKIAAGRLLTEQQALYEICRGLFAD